MSDVAAAFRLVRAGWIMVREGVVAALPGDQLSGLPKFGWRVARLFTKRQAPCAAAAATGLPAAIARLGPSYVKLGQFLATRPDVVGNDIALDLALLQDRMETFPMAESVAAIEGSLGRPVGEPVPELRRARRRRLDRAGPCRRSRPRRRARRRSPSR